VKAIAGRVTADGLVDGHFEETARRRVAFDGCLYNRAVLPAAASDAGRLALLMEREGAPGLARVNGDFACAIVEPETRTVRLARDRFGVRPLHYALVPGGIVFATRTRDILARPEVDGAVSPLFCALLAGCHYRYFFNDPAQTPFQAVRQVPAGCALTWTDGRVEIAPYWNLQDAAEPYGPDRALAEQLRALLLDAVEIRLAAAARPIFSLSGGMDSSSVLSCACALGGAKQEAISAVYDDPTYDESGDIAEILEATVERWHPVRVEDGPDLLDRIAAIIERTGEPIPTATWLANYAVLETAGALGHDVIFGGLGGDELNAGEYEHFLYHFADLAVRGDDSGLERETTRWAQLHDHPVFRKSPAIARSEIERLTDPARPGRCLPDRRRLLRYAAALNPDFFDLAAYEPVMEHPFTSYLRSRTFQDLTRETIPPCLRAGALQADAVGLGQALPFLDPRLVEFMFRVPGRLKIRDGVAKVLLREAMRGIVPDAARLRARKTGWNAPAHLWFAGRGAEAVRALIHDPVFRQRGIYDLASVERLLADHERIVARGAAEDNHMMFFWQLVNLELWLRTRSEHRERTLAATGACP
jgi:asparagine synthase (glutamine-hydrolysing)